MGTVEVVMRWEEFFVEVKEFEEQQGAGRSRVPAVGKGPVAIER